MDSSSPNAPGRSRKRRAINACTNCRASKVRCDGNKPSCQRCIRNDIQCQYYDAVKDPTVLRIENLEHEIAALRTGLENVSNNTVAQSPRTPLSAHSNFGSNSSVLPGAPDPGANTRSYGHAPPSIPSSFPQTVTSAQMMTPSPTCNSVDKGLVTWDQASLWFRSFFSGSHYLVPIFCEQTDTFESVRSRSSFLFDAIISIGCRAEEGFSSAIYHRLQARLRDHLTTTLIDSSNTPQLEVIQAIAIMASYSESGFILIALALRFAMSLGLPDTVDRLLDLISHRSRSTGREEKELYKAVRVWYGICNLELFFSLDGGKVPGITLTTSPRRIRALVRHPEGTAVDIRLLSQIELNMIRSNAYQSIASQRGTSILPESQQLLRTTVRDTTIELSLWLEEWTSIITVETPAHHHSFALLNLHIQYEWAIITLHLKALSDSGIENIALMDDFQRDMVRTAKEAAVRHLHHLLEASTPPSLNQPSAHHHHSEQHRPGPAYLTTFKWTMDYVWAKLAFSILLVLKLALLLRDPPSTLISLLRDAHKVLEELKRITVGHIAYFHILQVSIEKCEGALKEYMAESGLGEGDMNIQSESVGVGGEEGGQAEKDFEGYVPTEFVFEWDFPGLNLKHAPLSWQDLFIDLDNVF